MKSREFLAKLDDTQIVSEIAQAERSTSGEIRVFVSLSKVDDAVRRAQRRFEKLGMARTKLRNGVLLYFAPRSKKFAVVGDVGIHEKCGPVFWQEVTTEIRAHLRSGRFTEGVIHGVRKVGEVLARHFPPQADDRNELANEIESD